MGKYDTWMKADLLLSIANELAEANRLKRVELLMSKDMWEDEKGNESHTFVSINDLEDNA